MKNKRFMEYYNIDAFSEDKDTQELIRGIYSRNNACFLSNLYREIEHYETWETNNPSNQISTTFRDVLYTFYKFYTGDKLAWIHHTMNIIYPFKDFATDLWIEHELNSLSGDILNQREVLNKYKTMIHKRDCSLDEILLKIGEPFGWTSAQSLRNTWYNL